MYDYNSKISTCQYRVLIYMFFIIIYILIDNYNKKEDEQICCFINDLIDVIVSGDVYISNESDKIIDLFCDYRDLQIKLSDEFSFFELNKWNEERKINKKNN